MTRGRRPHPDILTPREWEVLELIRQQLTNQEIAERLRISERGAKFHVSEILSKLGVQSRREAASWHETDQPFVLPTIFVQALLSTRSRLTAAALTPLRAFVIVLTLVGFGLLLHGLFSSGKNGPNHEFDEIAGIDFPTPTALPKAALSSPTGGSYPQSSSGLNGSENCTRELPNDFQRVSPKELQSEGFVQLGQVIEPYACPLRVANRADQAFVWLADGAEVSLAKAGLHIVTDFGEYQGSNQPLSDLGFYYEGEQFRLLVTVQEENQMLWPGDKSTLNVAYDPSEEVIHLVPVADSGAYLNFQLVGEQSGPRRVLVDSKGEIFFAPAPLSGDLVTNWLTGKVVSTNEMEPAGHLVSIKAARTARTDCMEGSLCQVYLDGVAGVLQAPLAGTLRCVPIMSAGRERTAYELDAGWVKLGIVPYAGQGSDWVGGCKDQSVSQGDDINAWPFTYISALEPDGTPESIVSSRDGQLFVGLVQPDFACPCAPRH